MKGWIGLFVVFQDSCDAGGSARGDNPFMAFNNDITSLLQSLRSWSPLLDL
jgi:hypothetical protein